MSSSTTYYRSRNQQQQAQPAPFYQEPAQQRNNRTQQPLSNSSQDVRNNNERRWTSNSGGRGQQPRFYAPQHQQQQPSNYNYYPPEEYYYYEQQQYDPLLTSFPSSQQQQQRRPLSHPASSIRPPQPLSSQVFYPTASSSLTANSSSRSARQTNECGSTGDLRSTLTEQLLTNTYECMICFSKIQRQEAIWSCDICYKLFHLGCIKKWASSEESGENRNWRCPGCQYHYDKTPVYFCFCRKMANPPFQPGEVPHACGEMCGKRLNAKSNECTHFCTELCHPGSCPTCTTMVKRSCLCGRERRTVQCSSNALIKCENVCGKVRSCRNHVCELICHPRECDPCTEVITQHCSSHHTQRQVQCTPETGGKSVYRCGEKCDKELECGHHTCPQLCHTGFCQKCSLLPDVHKTCACGQTQMDNRQRTSCLDPLPLCSKQCNKVLPCGPSDAHHLCSVPCHNGPCPPCDKETKLICRCGSESKSMACQEASQFDPLTHPFLCERRCTKKKMCGKHRCNEHCCNREVHLCELVCGKMLNCGNHTCEELCHKNACRKCPVNSYDELTCRCGRTVLQPPIACGTPLPACNYPCTRIDHACDHPVYHSCHNEPECPPCTHLVSKMCVGGHTKRDNVPCHLREVFCGQQCGKQLPCLMHTCLRTCHSGPCQPLDSRCTQLCPVRRRECFHPCNAPCHGRDSCPKTVCKELIRARCPCGRLSRDIVCNSRPGEQEDSSGGEETSLAQSLAQALSVKTLDLSAARKQQEEKERPQLECDDECRVQARNRSFAQALAINVDEHRAAQAQAQYTDWLRDYARKNMEFVQQVERHLTTLVEETQRHRAAKRCYSFKPMKINERRLVHELAAFYGLETMAQDPEPHRNVVAYSALNTCKLPAMTLSECVRREKGSGLSKIPPPVSLGTL